MPTRTLKFRYTLFPDTLNCWNHLSSFIKSSISLNVFKKRLMEFLNVTPNPICGIHNPVGLKYLTRLRVGLRHLRAHKHQYNFNDTSSKYCSCRDNLPETVEHYLLHCPIYSLLRRELLEISGWLLVFLLSPHQLTHVTCFCMVTLATTFIPIKKFFNLQLALSFRIKDLMVLLFPMTNDLIFPCVACITFNYLLSLVCLFTFFEGKGRGELFFGPLVIIVPWGAFCLWLLQKKRVVGERIQYKAALESFKPG